MTDADLIRLVAKMRQWQVEFRKTNDNAALRYARDYEARVDAELASRAKGKGMFDPT